MEIHQGINWMTPIKAFLEKKTMPPLAKKRHKRSGTVHHATTFLEVNFTEGPPPNYCSDAWILKSKDPLQRWSMKEYVANT